MLNNHTYYSLRYGTIEPKALLQLAKDKGYSSIALTDINNTSACLDFVRLAPNYGIKPVLGIDFRKGAEQLFVGLAKNNEGFYTLNKTLSHYNEHKIPFEYKAPALDNCFIIYPFSSFYEKKLHASELNENEFIGIATTDIFKLKFSDIRKHPNKLVLLQTASFKNKSDFNAHRLLRAIDNNCLLSKLPQSEEEKPTT